MKKTNKKMILTVLLIILILSVNVINTFALDDDISIFSVHIHNFNRILELSSLTGYYNDDGHYVIESGYLNCTTCYYSVPFDEEILKPHNVRVKPVINNEHLVCEYCTMCDYYRYYSKGYNY